MSQPPSADAREGAPRFPPYDGTTYYGRAQLKTAPFENPVVGGYIFLAGLSGAAAILAAIAAAGHRPALERVARRGRYLTLLAPLLGAPLLVYDLHTPKRFLNMLRVAKSTSPMSIGTWILMAFSAFAGLGAAAQMGADLLPRRRERLRGRLAGLARRLGVPAAVAGAGLSTYTGSLLASTSTPLWAAAPRALAAQFGASSLAAAAASLAVTERDGTMRARLDAVQAGALLAEAAATAMAHARYARTGLSPALDEAPGPAATLANPALSLALPLGLLAIGSMVPGRSGRAASRLAGLATLAGSALLRVAVMDAGDASAARPDLSFRFASPGNLPRR